MGKIRTTLTIENSDDRAWWRRGHGSLADVRGVTVDGIVDTDTMSLVVPEELATGLGLRQFGRRTVVYANEQREERLVAGPVTVQIGRLAMHTDCIVGAPGSEVVIGRIVLEALDLGVDHTNQTLAPRHPEGPVLALR